LVEIHITRYKVVAMPGPKIQAVVQALGITSVQTQRLFKKKKNFLFYMGA